MEKTNLNTSQNLNTNQSQSQNTNITNTTNIKQSIQKITILGAGAFGFAMAHVLSNNNLNLKITLYDIQTEVIEHIQQNSSHPFFHEGVKLPANVSATTNFTTAIENTNIIVLAIPSKFFRKAAQNLNQVADNMVFLNLAKGLEQGTNMRISQILKENCSKNYTYATLSGGMIASEVTKNAPLGADIACEDEQIAKLLKSLIESNTLSIRTSTDVIGVELSGALKNVVAIGAGIMEAKLKESSKSGYITAISSEMQTLAKALGAKTDTFMPGSFSWWGDLMTTCFGASRNREYGKRVGSGMDPKEALEQMYAEKKSVEGYITCKVVYDLIQKHSLIAPITTSLYKLLYEQILVEEFIKSAMKN